MKEILRLIDRAQGKNQYNSWTSIQPRENQKEKKRMPRRWFTKYDWKWGRSFIAVRKIWLLWRKELMFVHSLIPEDSFLRVLEWYLTTAKNKINNCWCISCPMKVMTSYERLRQNDFTLKVVSCISKLRKNSFQEVLCFLHVSRMQWILLRRDTWSLLTKRSRMLS